MQLKVFSLELGNECSNKTPDRCFPYRLDHERGLANYAYDPSTVSGVLWVAGVGIPTQALIALPKFTPFIALPIAFAQAMKVLRKKSAIDTAMLARYFLGAPAWIFLALLILISVMTLIFAPLTFVYGLFYGSVPALAGTAVHCLGMVPLYLLNRAGLVRSRG